MAYRLEHHEYQVFGSPLEDATLAFGNYRFVDAVITNPPFETKPSVEHSEIRLASRHTNGVSNPTVSYRKVSVCSTSSNPLPLSDSNSSYRPRG